MKQSKRVYILMLLIFVLGSSCNLFNIVEKKDPIQNSRDSMEQLFSYVPLVFVEEKSPGFIVAPIYYLDYERMRYELDLPLIESSAPWQDKIQLYYGYYIQGMIPYPSFVNLMNSEAYVSYGLDFTDVEQVMYLMEMDTAIMRGHFDAEQIDKVLSERFIQNYVLGYSVYFDETGEEFCLAISGDMVLIGPMYEIVEFLILHHEYGEPSVVQNPHIQLLLDNQDNPYGFALVRSGYVSSYVVDDERALQKNPFLHEIEQYEFDWDMMMISYRSEEEIADLAITYTFSSDSMAETYIPIIETTLTDTQIIGSYDGVYWSDVVHIQQINQNGELVQVEATTLEDKLIGRAFFGGDYFGLLPVRKVGTDSFQ